MLVPGAARAQDPLYLGWPEILPPAPGTFLPSTEEDCLEGRTKCVDQVIREMQRRFNPLASSCNHDAIFSLAYLRTTQAYRRAIEDPNFFQDTAFVNHEDVIFAEYYFRAFDAWHSVLRDGTPRAWAIAFEAADRRQVSAAGNLTLGMNAHIQRDLPFALASIGITAPDGTSRKSDHDRVNRILNTIPDDLLPEIASRFDDTIDDGNLPTMVDDIVTFQSVPAWREKAWRNAERLVAAKTAGQRALVAADIEAYAASQAATLRSLTAYPPGQNSARRDAYCAANQD
jgi:hypothetical protein